MRGDDVAKLTAMMDMLRLTQKHGSNAVMDETKNLYRGGKGMVGDINRAILEPIHGSHEENMKAAYGIEPNMSPEQIMELMGQTKKKKKAEKKAKAEQPSIIQHYLDLATGYNEDTSHADLLTARRNIPSDHPMQKKLRPLEHGAFAQQFAEDSPIRAGLSMPFAIPAYGAAKMMGLTANPETENGTTLDAMAQAYRGLGRGLFGGKSK